MFKKIMIHIFGLIVLAFGITGVVMARLGASPLDAFNQYLSMLIPWEFVTLGVTTFVSNFIMALVIFALTRRKELGISVLLTFVLSAFITMWLYLIGLVPTNISDMLYFRIPLAILALFGSAYGLSVLIINALSLTPYDEVTMFVAEKTNSIRNAKIYVEGGFLIGAIILALIAKDWTYINVFSVVVVVALGPLINMFMNIIQRRIEKNETKQVYWSY